MTDAIKPTFVLRWEIDPSQANLATGKVVSAVFNEGGFKWTLSAERTTGTSNVVFTLRCNENRNGTWKCSGVVQMHAIRTNGPDLDHVSIEVFHFGGTRCSLQLRTKIPWDCFTADNYKINGKITINFHIYITRSEQCVDAPIIDLTKFASPNEVNNVTLVIGCQKIRVCKDYLAIHSPVFAAMFYGDFVEKGKEEVELKEVAAEEFIDLLRLIYLGTVEITDHTVLHLLKLADLYEMKRVLEMSEQHLKTLSRLNIAKKLQLADQYRLISLKNHCLQSFTSVADVMRKLKTSSEFADYSMDMKGAICEQMMKINLQ